MAQQGLYGEKNDCVVFRRFGARESPEDDEVCCSRGYGGVSKVYEVVEKRDG